jgi:hypothetical protein
MAKMDNYIGFEGKTPIFFVKNAEKSHHNIDPWNYLNTLCLVSKKKRKTDCLKNQS